MANTTRTVVITGDVTIDWLLLSQAPRERGALDFIWMWGGDYLGRQLASAGAAASHAEILRRTVVAAGIEGVEILGAHVAPEALRSPFHPGYSHTFADIAEFPKVLGHSETAWRIAEFKGTDPAISGPGCEPPHTPDEVETVLIVDHAVGYRNSFSDLPALLDGRAGPHHLADGGAAPRLTARRPAAERARGSPHGAHVGRRAPQGGPAGRLLTLVGADDRGDLRRGARAPAGARSAGDRRRRRERRRDHRP